MALSGLQSNGTGIFVQNAAYPAQRPRRVAKTDCSGGAPDHGRLRTLLLRWTVFTFLRGLPAPLR